MTDYQINAVFLILFFLFLIWAYKFVNYLEARKKDKDEVFQLEEDFLSEYQKYRPYLYNEDELNLEQPKRLQVDLNADTFTNNEELRHVFMQVAYYLRLMHIHEQTSFNTEIEDIFKDIRKFAYSEGEDILNL